MSRMETTLDDKILIEIVKLTVNIKKPGSRGDRRKDRWKTSRLQETALLDEGRPML